MNCPQCNSIMQPGAASLDASTTDQVLEVVDMIITDRVPRRTPVRLYFRATNGPGAVLVPMSPAQHCARCQILVLGPAASPAPADESEAIECLSCGKTIPAGADRCACGWSWAEGASTE